MQPWGLYVHVPYCTSLCPYCDFNSHVDRQPPWDAFAAALLRELAYHAGSTFAGMPPLHSIYFGGGTPSLAPPALIGEVIEAARATFGLQPKAEITLEANPGTVSLALFEGLKEVGVNRVSLGWQSTHNRLLKVLGRGHDANQSAEALQLARAAGMPAVSLDLIFAVPTQTRQDCAADVQKILRIRPQHVSLYALTYHPGTPMHRRRQRGKVRAAPEELELEMMADIETALVQAGYDHYEISNYALPGHQAKHNSLYWQGGKYLGIGPGAHSFKHEGWQSGARWENTRPPEPYMAQWRNPVQGRAAAVPHVEWSETLTPAQLFTERMLCALRQPCGIDLREPVCQAHLERAKEGAAMAVQRGWATLAGHHLRPTQVGLRHADALAEIFF